MNNIVNFKSVVTNIMSNVDFGFYRLSNWEEGSSPSIISVRKFGGRAGIRKAVEASNQFNWPARKSAVPI